MAELKPEEVKVNRAACDVCGERVKVGSVRTDPSLTNLYTVRLCMRCLAAMMLALARVGKVDG